jgi:hypothetical protein
MSDIDRLRDESDVRKKLGLDPVPFKFYRCAKCGISVDGDLVVRGKMYCAGCAVRESLVDG